RRARRLAGLQEPRRIPRETASGGDRAAGLVTARRADLSDVEQPAAPHRRPEHAGRRQQTAVLAEHRPPGGHWADGGYACRDVAGRAAVLRPRLERAAPAGACLFIRTGDPPSSAARAPIE